MLKQKRKNSSMDSNAVLIAIPVFNELQYIEDILQAVREYSENILIVDDGSTDGSSEVLKNHTGINLITHRRNIGYGRSLIDTFRFAYDKNFDWIITLDCDHQHEPAYIPNFYRRIAVDDTDIISGSRYLKKIYSGVLPPPPERIAINRRITKILNDNLALGLTDAFCGFKAYRTSKIVELELSEDGYGLPLQLWIQAAIKRLRITEIPVPLIYHDPKRKFCGPLEDPLRRLEYYLKIIERELGYNVSRNLAETLNT